MNVERTEPLRDMSKFIIVCILIETTLVDEFTFLEYSSTSPRQIS